jgi:hypothetical protein
MIRVAIAVGGNFTGTLISDYSAMMPTNEYNYGSLKLHYEGNLFSFAYNLGIIENAIRDTS